MDKFFKIASSQYNEGVFFTEYNGKYQLLTGQTGKDDENYKKWVFPQGKDRLPGEKAIPMGVTIGGKDEAISILKAMLSELGGTANESQTHGANKEPVDEIPF